MAAANASARGQRAAILASPLHELTGFYLAVDCLTSACNGERNFAVAELASFYGWDCTVGQLLRAHAVFSRLCRTHMRRLAGDGTYLERASQPSTGAEFGFGGQGVGCRC